MKRPLIVPTTMLLLLLSRVSALAAPTIVLGTDVEDGKKMIHATVTSDGKPLTNITLDYFVQRTFGNLAIGEDTTLDDGTSAVAFPSDLPGNVDGMLHITAKVKSAAKNSIISADGVFPADTPYVLLSNPFSRALWAPAAPIGLSLAIVAILGAVWLSYLFVISQILSIRKAGNL